VKGWRGVQQAGEQQWWERWTREAGASSCLLAGGRSQSEASACRGRGEGSDGPP